jgi:ketosteroid isomerase-like protein
VVSEDLAVETSSYILTFNVTKIPEKDTLVWRKGSDDQWKISFDIWANNQ